MKKLVIVGNSHLRYYAQALKQDGTFDVNHMRISEVFDFVAKHGKDIAVVICELWAEHGKELDSKETRDKELTGAILTEKLLPLCPHATFFVFGADSLPRLKNKMRVIPLQVCINTTISELVDVVNRNTTTKGKL